MILKDNEVTKQKILGKSITYWNPGKVADWHNKGIDLVMGQRAGYCFSDMDGQRFLDIHINGGTFNLGHRNPELIQAMIEATQEFDIGNHHFPSITRALLAEKLASLCPESLQYSVFSPSGGEAVDVAIKSARYATKRKKVISLKGSYHGHTGLSVSAGDPLFKDPFLCQGEQDMFVQVPLNDLEAMESELKKEDTALVLIETLLATYGFPIPKEGYLQKVKALCEKYGALYAADEVQTGLMRTGTMWGFEHEGVVPDILISAKGLGGGIYPIAATVLNQRSAQWLFDIGRLHGSTTGGSEIGCCVALKVLEITTRQSTIDRVQANTRNLKQAMDVLRHKYSDFFLGYTQRGVIMGLDFNCKDAAVSVVKPLFDNGVWAHNARLHPNTLQLKLGLLCEDSFLEELFVKMDKGIGEAREKAFCEVR
jgi:acetylornithine/succinyldiaminopimelate/putrescine aminotransferase